VIVRIRFLAFRLANRNERCFRFIMNARAIIADDEPLARERVVHFSPANLILNRSPNVPRSADAQGHSRRPARPVILGRPNRVASWRIAEDHEALSRLSAVVTSIRHGPAAFGRPKITGRAGRLSGP